MVRCTSASSANKRVDDVILSDKSFIYRRNYKGPSTIPCGTPESTVTEDDVLPSRMTLCERPIRKDDIHEMS